MARIKNFNLFVYGTLLSPSVFRAVLGRTLVHRPGDADGVSTFYPREAVLHGYKKVSPDGTYLYAVPDPQGRIHGYLVGPLPGECMSALRRYEGKNYSRKRLRVQTADGPEQTVVFVGNLEQLEHHFGYPFQDPLKQEILLSEKIDEALGETQQEQLHSSELLGRRAVGELRGATIRDLVRHHFQSGGISDYAIRHSLKDVPLRDFSEIVQDPEARRLAPNYLAMVVRQVLFNQFEGRIRKEFRYELDHIPYAGEHYEHTVSSLVALRILNGAHDLLDVLVADCLTELDFQTSHLIDYVRWAIVAADALYDSRQARTHVQFVRNHVGAGYIPLGAELEFSDIGHEVIRDPEGDRVRDPRYDGFFYFPDFGLDLLTWKLGGHLDNHHVKSSKGHRRGFFEVALGSLSIEANLSKPVSNDPWLLNQFIHEAREFYDIRPHSVHISLQLPSRHRPVRDRALPLAAMKCLFALAGDAVRGPDGRMRIRRLTSDEIVNRKHSSMLFSEIRKRFSKEADEEYPKLRTPAEAGRYVQQYRFLRLAADTNYEPIILALKGLQVELRPGTFLTRRQHESSRKLRGLYRDLLAWGGQPEPLSPDEIEAFLGPVYRGLMRERNGKPAHRDAYIAWAIEQLRDELKRFNRRVCRPTDG